MSQRNASLQAETLSMRNLGRTLPGQGFFEVDLVSGHIIWVNDFVLEQSGYTIDQIISMTVFDLVPPQFHEGVRNSISDQTKGRFHKFSIWPIFTADRNLIWWYTVRVKFQHPVYWYRGEFLNKTKTFGPEYTSMHAAMDTTNGYNELSSRLEDHEAWTEKQINKLSDENAAIISVQSEIKVQLEHAIAAAASAANAALENSESIKTIKTEIQDQLSNQTAEILRLISTDTVQNERIATFERHMKATTEKAVQTITTQANKAGQGLSRKVTVPVGTIAAIATIIQWLIQNWPHKLFSHNFSD